MAYHNNQDYISLKSDSSTLYQHRIYIYSRYKKLSLDNRWFNYAS